MRAHAAAGGAALGAWLAPDLGLWFLVGLGLLLAARHVGWRVLAALLTAALLATASAHHSRAALDFPEAGAFDQWVALVDDPRPSGPVGIRVTVRADDRRHTATAHGATAGRLDNALAGERVRLVGTIRPVSRNDSRSIDRHIVGRITVAEVAAAGPAAPIAAAANGVRERLADGASSLSRSDHALFLGMVIGDDRGQTPVTADDFRAGGLGHLLVVSGQNVAFVLAVAMPLAGRFRPAGRALLLFSVLGVFAVMTRFEPSVLRATAMAGIGIGGSALGRPVDGRAGLSWAVAGLLVLDPFLIRVVAFQLSAAATAGIVWLSRPLSDRLWGPSWWTIPASTTISAQLAVSPLLLALFGPLPLASLPANLLAGPASGAVMIWGCTGGLLAGVLGGPAADALHLPTKALMCWIGGVARLSAAAPPANLGGMSLGLIAAAVGVSLKWRRRGPALVSLVVVIVVLGQSITGAPTPAPGTSALGDGVLVHCANHDCVVTLDDPVSARRVLERLRVAGVRNVVLIAATDGDRSDADAVLALHSRFRCDRGPAASSSPRCPHRRCRARGDRRPDHCAVHRSPASSLARVPRHGIVPVRSATMFLALGDTRFDITTRALVMGILNRTPDSFYDGGRYWDFDDFLRKAEVLVDEGADFLDVGGSKAGPGPEVTPAEEMERVVPAIDALRQRFDLPISVDTFRASVLDEACKVGACVGNDISGFADPEFLPVAARHGASVVATQVRIGPRIPDPDPTYDDVRTDVTNFLRVRAQVALDAGIPRERVMVDAGLDLGKSPAMSTELLRHSDDLVELGFPVFLSASNKGFLGELAGTEVDDRREATFGAHALGIALGCRVLRAHDVRGNRRLADMMSAVLQHRRS